jgi:protein tyrosine/serine phosphatase
MPKLAKQTRRAMKRVTLAWRQGLIDHSPEWARKSLGPAANWLDMLLVDHGIFRLAYLNRHPVGPSAWRAAQPAPPQIRDMAARGIRTIVNLRGPRLCGSYWLEKAACRKYGIALVDFQIRSRAAPTRSEILAARDLFERIEYPMLMHCKSGADRAGLMSVLYCHFRLGQPIAQAKAQLALRYGHIRQADTGVLDYVFERYEADNRRFPIGFLDWVEASYDPDEMKRTFHANRWANLLTNGILRRE